MTLSISNPSDWLDQALEFIHARDRGGDVVYANPMARARFGWSAGRSALDEESEMTVALRIALQEGFWRGEVSRVDAHGNALLLRSHWTAIRDKKEAVVGFFVVEFDLTEENSHREASRRAQRLEGIGTLAGGVAHEINNVLGPILMGAEMIRGRVEDPWIQKKLLSMEESARRGAQVVKQVLDFSRGVEGEMTTLDPRLIIKDVVSFARQTFTRSVDIVLDSSDDLAFAHGDATLLRQVLLNLMLNARDAMPDGGTLTIRARNVEIAQEEAARLSPEAYEGAFLCVDVVDTGEGLSDGVRDRMFEPFFTTRSRGQGTGLGLSTALTIVRSHDGFIVVGGARGQGASFSVYIPTIAASDSADSSDHINSQESMGSELTILVVDDEPFMLEMNLDILESFGFTAVGARNGREGVEAFQGQSQIDLVITDMNMPVMDGATMIREIRKLAPEMPFLAISGMPEHRHLVEGTGIDDVGILQKPYTASQLMAAVESALDMKTPGSAGEAGPGSESGADGEMSEDEFDSSMGGGDW